MIYVWRWRRLAGAHPFPLGMGTVTRRAGAKEPGKELEQLGAGGEKGKAPGGPSNPQGPAPSTLPPKGRGVSLLK